MPAALDLKDKQFGRWTAIRKVAPGKWECRCSCSDETVKVVLQKHLSSGASQSCGCLFREMLVKRNTTHGMSDDKAFQAEQKALWRKKNKELILQQAKEYRERPGMREKKAKYMATYRKDKKEYLKDKQREYNERNPEVQAESNARRRAAKRRAIPNWDKELTKQVFKDLKKAAIAMEQSSGIKFHIDHIVPLTGMIGTQHVVCGLHVHNNLQLLPAAVNCEKGPRHWPNMPDSML